MLAMISVDMAASNPEFGASLARQLHQSEPWTPGSDAEIVAAFLHAVTTTITQHLREPSTVAAAAELARSWSGAAMAQRVRDASTGDPDDVDLDILLAFAAAQTSRLLTSARWYSVGISPCPVSMRVGHRPWPDYATYLAQLGETRGR
jgi:hypothetical protein